MGFGGWAYAKRPCIFPYYMDDNDTPYDKCDLFGEPSFIVPVWRCPVFNITRKQAEAGMAEDDQGQIACKSPGGKQWLMIKLQRLLKKFTCLR